jgi:hypothetical protein
MRCGALSSHEQCNGAHSGSVDARAERFGRRNGKLWPECVARCPEPTEQRADGPELRLSRLAARQKGVFTRAQALELGVAPTMLCRRIESGLWQRVLPRVYRIATAPPSWRQKVMAGCLWTGGGASHRSAARLYGLEGVHARSSEKIELTAERGATCSAVGFVVHTTRCLERNDLSVCDEIPVTSLSRTLFDIAPLLDARQLAMALDSGLAMHRGIDERFLIREVARLRASGRRNSQALVFLIHARGPDAVPLDSALERRFLAAILEAGLPRPRAHFEVVEGGRRLAEVDFAYPRARLAIQLHGAAVHRRYSVWQRDQDQSSELAAAGWRVLCVTWAQLERCEASVIDRVRRALGTY